MAPPLSLHQAFDEARFGPSRTLNLREGLPTAEEASRRAEAWLRGKQVEQVGEVLIITGRGNSSPGNVSVVREAVHKLFAPLRRRGVITSAQEHTPGSFVVTLAPIRALFASGRRHRDGHPAPVETTPPSLGGLDAPTLARLRVLARRTIESLGMQNAAEAYVVEEMERQFGLLMRGAPATDAQQWLNAAIDRAIDEYDEAGH